MYRAVSLLKWCSMESRISKLRNKWPNRSVSRPIRFAHG